MGIKIAKLKETHKGRAIGSKEDTLQFLAKDKNQKALQYLKQGFKGVEVAKLIGMHFNTIIQIKRWACNSYNIINTLFQVVSPVYNKKPLTY